MNLFALPLIRFAPVIYHLKSLVVIKCIKETPTEPGRAASFDWDGAKQEQVFEHVGKRLRVFNQCQVLPSKHMVRIGCGWFE